MVLGGSLWFLVVFVSSLLFLVVLCGSWAFLVVLEGSGWLLVIDVGFFCGFFPGMFFVVLSGSF